MLAGRLLKVFSGFKKRRKLTAKYGEEQFTHLEHHACVGHHVIVRYEAHICSRLESSF